MWSDFNPKLLTREQLAARITSLEWDDWEPVGITLHNTAAPTLAQWRESGPQHDARIRNLQQYYEGMGWHGGPHWFVSRNYINEFSNPLRRGTHSPSFNAEYFGIEMVGDYNDEPFDSGDGALVRDNAVYLMALLCRKFGWQIERVLKLHKEDPRTTHDCPGSNVSKADVIRRVQAQMAALGGTPAKPAPAVASPATLAPGRQIGITATEFGGTDDVQASSYGGMVAGDELEVSLPAKDSRRSVRVYYGSRSVVCKLNDLGPWNKRDDYWNHNARPAAEAQFKNGDEADNGKVPTNPAGIDLTPAVFEALGLPGGKAVVDWEFTSAAPAKIARAVVAPGMPPDVGPVDGEPPPKAKGGLWGIMAKIGAVFSGGGAALFYDWRVVSLVLFAVAVLVALFVDVRHIRRIVSETIEKSFGGKSQ